MLTLPEELVWNNYFGWLGGRKKRLAWHAVYTVHNNAPPSQCCFLRFFPLFGPFNVRLRGTVHAGGTYYTKVALLLYRPVTVSVVSCIWNQHLPSVHVWPNYNLPVCTFAFNTHNYTCKIYNSQILITRILLGRLVLLKRLCVLYCIGSIVI